MGLWQKRVVPGLWRDGNELRSTLVALILRDNYPSQKTEWWR
jgi:hypothetical protein